MYVRAPSIFVVAGKSAMPYDVFVIGYKVKGGE